MVHGKWRIAELACLSESQLTLFINIAESWRYWIVCGSWREQVCTCNEKTVIWPFINFHRHNLATFGGQFVSKCYKLFILVLSSPPLESPIAKFPSLSIKPSLFFTKIRLPVLLIRDFLLAILHGASYGHSDKKILNRMEENHSSFSAEKKPKRKPVYSKNTVHHRQVHGRHIPRKVLCVDMLTAELAWTCSICA